MKWFKHETKRTAQLKRLIMEYGLDGYGLYHVCLELIAGELSIDNLTFELEEDAELIAHEFKVDTLKVEKIMHRCVELGLFDLSDNGKLRCMALAKLLDESISRNTNVKQIKEKVTEKLDKYSKKAKIPESIPNDSGECRDGLGKNPSRREENRIEENRIYNNTDKSVIVPGKPGDKSSDLSKLLHNQIKSFFADEYTKINGDKIQNWGKESKSIQRIVSHCIKSDDPILKIKTKAKLLYDIVKNPRNDFERSLKFLPSELLCLWDKLTETKNKNEITGEMWEYLKSL